MPSAAKGEVVAGREKRPHRGDDVSKSELAYEAIRQRIANGTYGSGYRLVFHQIAQELSISPVPVREAIRRLEAEGYVVFQRNIGAQVAHIDVEEYTQVMQLLAVLEAAATSLALPFLGDADLDRAREINESMRASLEAFDPLAFTRANREFHEVLYGKCPNERLLSLIARERKRLDAIRRSTFSFVPEHAHDAVKEHERIIELIASGAEESRIEWAVRDHRNATIEVFRVWHQSHAGA